MTEKERALGAAIVKLLDSYEPTGNEATSALASVLALIYMDQPQAVWATLHGYLDDMREFVRNNPPAMDASPAQPSRSD